MGNVIIIILLAVIVFHVSDCSNETHTRNDVTSGKLLPEVDKQKVIHKRADFIRPKVRGDW